MSAETKLAGIRRSRALPFGMDLIDGGNDLELAPSRKALILDMASRLEATGGAS